MGDNNRSPGFFETDDRTPEQSYGQGRKDAENDTYLDDVARGIARIPDTISDARTDNEKSYDKGVDDERSSGSWWSK